MIINSISLYIDLVEKIIDFIEGKRRKQRAMDTPLGDTLKKVEVAQEHLTDAIESIDVIREQVVAEKGQLDTLLAEVASKRLEYKETSSDLKATQNLLNQDQRKLRTALGVNSSREKIVGFVSGIVASIIATAIWVSGSTIWPFILNLFVTA
jgi:chromosome segregation ATPase